LSASSHPLALLLAAARGAADGGMDEALEHQTNLVTDRYGHIGHSAPLSTHNARARVKHMQRDQ
jgi:hypothetical protein